MRLARGRAATNQRELLSPLSPGNHSLWLALEGAPAVDPPVTHLPFVLELEVTYLPTSAATTRHFARDAGAALPPGAALELAHWVPVGDALGSVQAAAACHLRPVPPDLNVPEYLGPDGFMHVGDWFFLDLTVAAHPIRLRLATHSWLRVYVPGHAVDVDMLLTSADGARLAAAAEKHEEDTLSAEVGPGEYTLTLLLFASPAVRRRPARCAPLAAC